MNPKNGSYKMPNGEIEYFPLSDIETSLRREQIESKSKKIDYLFWALMLGLLIVSILHFVVEPLITPVAHAEGYSNQSALCTQYLHDTKLAGTAAEQTLLTICN